MSKIEKVIFDTKVPNTRKSLVSDFKRVGLKAGDKILVHSSLSKLGWVCGGEIAVVQALMDVITEEGLIVMPTHSGDYCDPVFWGNPPVPSNWYSEIRREMPAFDPEITPTLGMGKIVEYFRNFPGVKRSYHPTVSFAAWGKNADFIIQNHSLSYSMGEESPLARFYELDGKVMFLGVDYDNNTSFHLSEYRAKNYSLVKNASPIIEDGKKVFKVYDDIEFRTELFMFAGEEFEEKYNVYKDTIGNAEIKIFSQRECVDFGVEYFKNRTF